MLFVPHLLASVLLLVSPQIPDRSIRTPEDGVDPEKIYGPPEPAEVSDLVAGAFFRRPVVTRGVLEILDPGRYYTLQDGGARVTIIPVPILRENLSHYVGIRVEVKGFVRELEARQGTCLHRGVLDAPQSVCDDPELPPKPDIPPGRERWPRTSLTIWSITDVSPRARKREAEDDATAFSVGPGEEVHVRGQFGGANLARVLTSAAPEPEAWVLTVSETAVWVVGKAPRGNGFRLDRDYRGDLGKWLEVEGRMAVCKGTPCLKASRIKLIAAPPAREDDP